MFGHKTWEKKIVQLKHQPHCFTKQTAAGLTKAVDLELASQMMDS